MHSVIFYDRLGCNKGSKWAEWKILNCFKAAELSRNGKEHVTQLPLC